MRASACKTWGSVIAAVGVIVMASLPLLAAQGSAAQDAAKKYEKYLGKYEFDLSSLGGGPRIFEFYVKDGSFWIEYGFTSPGELKPVAETPDQFTFTDPDDGLSTLTFLKDETGAYVKARLVTASLQLDIVGTKRK